MLEANALQSFPLLDRYHGIRLGIELASAPPGRAAVVESARRLRAEQSYGYVHALWWLWLEDGRSVISVPPGAGAEARRAVGDAALPEAIWDVTMTARLRAAADAALRRAGLGETDRVLRDLVFACNAALLREHRRGDCRRLSDKTIPAAEGLRLPTHCFPEGIAYGVVADGRIASVAYGHRTGLMEDCVADLGVETAPAYRRRGYASTAVSAVVGHVAREGGEARYGCDPANMASIATARSVGFVPYGRSLILSAPAPNLGQ
jgi:ribosomal protein S18 acetylase RimI-like enzyme